MNVNLFRVRPARPRTTARLLVVTAALRVPVLTLVVLGIMTTQVVMGCVWRLVTMARRGTVFSHRAFRFVDVVIRAVATAVRLTPWLPCARCWTASPTTCCAGSPPERDLGS